LGQPWWQTYGSKSPTEKSGHEQAFSSQLSLTARGMLVKMYFNAIITGSAVALHCCKAHERIN